MRSLIFLAALSLAFAANAQTANEQPANAQPASNGAKAGADAMDPATKARVLLEGVPGGTGARVPKEASGGATVGNGDQHRYSLPKLPDPEQDKNPYRDEKKAGEEKR